MTGEVSFTVNELVVPGLAAGDGERVAATLRLELARLWAEDNCVGREWGDRLESVSLELDGQQDAERIGMAIARAVRDQALRSRGAS